MEEKIFADKNDINRPYVVCHMFTSLDGKIDGAFFGASECGAALAEYGNIRNFYNCQATLYGTTTMMGGYSDGIVGELPQTMVSYPKEDYIAQWEVKNYVVSIDPQGILGWNSGYIEKKGRPKAHVIEVLTEQVPDGYLEYLRRFDISYVFAGKEQLDCRVLLEKLYKLFHIERLMIAGGGLINWSFAQEDLIDELSLVIAPVADGSTTAVSIFEKPDFLPSRPPVAFELKEVKQLEDSGLWLRYQTK